MTSYKIESAPITGRMMSQPSKSMAHRALICAALSKGTSKIDNIVLSDDITATLNAIMVLGADVLLEDSRNYNGRKCVIIKGYGRVALKADTVDCLESGSTARFIMPITRLTNETICITGKGRLIERPFDLYKELFTEKGIVYTDCDGKMPITLTGRLIPGDYTLPGDVSSQFVSGLLFTLPLLEGNSRIIITKKLESLPYVMMTIKALSDFGIRIHCNDNCSIFEIPGNQEYKAAL